MALSPSARLGSYERIAQIGVGGIGEVYRAKDTRPPREVAIRYRHNDSASNSPSKRRSSPRSIIPNISTLYDVGDDYWALVA